MASKRQGVVAVMTNNNGSGNGGDSNTLRLGGASSSRRVPAQATELVILGYLTLGDLNRLREASRDCVVLVKLFLAQVKVLCDKVMDDDLNGLRLLRGCEHLTELDLSARTLSDSRLWRRRYPAVRDLIASVIAKNAVTLERLTILPRANLLLQSPQIIRALSACVRLRAFDAVGLKDRSVTSSDYSQACAQLFANCCHLTNIAVGRPLRWRRSGAEKHQYQQLNPEVVRQVLTRGRPLESLTLHQVSTTELRHLNRPVSRLWLDRVPVETQTAWRSFCSTLADKLQSVLAQELQVLRVTMGFSRPDMQAEEMPEPLPDVVLPSSLVDCDLYNMSPYLLGCSARGLPDIRVASSTLQWFRARLPEASLLRLLTACPALVGLKIDVLGSDYVCRRHAGEFGEETVRAFATLKRLKKLSLDGAACGNKMLAELSRLDRLDFVSIVVSRQASSAAVADMMVSLPHLRTCYLLSDGDGRSAPMFGAALEDDLQAARARDGACHQQQHEIKRTPAASLERLESHLGMLHLLPLSYPRLTRLTIIGEGRSGISRLQQLVDQCPMITHLLLCKLDAADVMKRLLPTPPRTLQCLELNEVRGPCSAFFRQVPTWAPTLTELHVINSIFEDASELTVELVGSMLRQMPDLKLCMDALDDDEDIAVLLEDLKDEFPGRMVPRLDDGVATDDDDDDDDDHV